LVWKEFVLATRVEPNAVKTLAFVEEILAGVVLQIDDTKRSVCESS
jgi:hypothetical protein